MLTGFKVAAVSYSGGAPDFPVPPAGQEALSFGHHLLRSYAFPNRWLFKITSLDEALRIIRSGLRLPDDKLLIITVDEIMELDKMAKDTNENALARTVSSLMRVQDTTLVSGREPVVFIFSSILERLFPDLEKKTGSGRPVSLVPLQHLKLQEAHELLFRQVPGLQDAAARSSALRQLILSCMGHPRALFEGIKNTVDVTRTNVIAVEKYRHEILTMCKLDALMSVDGSNVVEDWFRGATESPKRERLITQGVLHIVDGVPFILPLMLQEWAARVATDQGRPHWALAYHLREAYDADCAVEATQKKKVEELMMHYEAVRRICRAGRKDELLGSFFPTKFIGPSWETRRVVVKLPPVGPDGIVAYVDDFSDVEAVLRLLRDGYIVVSTKQRAEQGLAYASPFFDSEDETTMLVAVAQVKFVSGTVVKRAGGRRELDPGHDDDVEDAYDEGEEKGDAAVEEGEGDEDAVKPNEFTRQLEDKGIAWFPVLYTTRRTTTQSSTGRWRSKTFADGVYFDELTLFDFTRPLGILRIHLEKLGGGLRRRCPTLARPRPSKQRHDPHDDSGTRRKGPKRECELDSWR